MVKSKKTVLWSVVKHVTALFKLQVAMKENEASSEKIMEFFYDFRVFKGLSLKF